MIMKYVDHLAYLLLILAFVFAVFTFMVFRYDPTAQLRVVLTSIVFYIIWGIVYHYTKRQLNKKLFLEYLLLAAISSVAVIIIFY